MEGCPIAKQGYSRDQRSDCKQVVIALVVSRCGMPLGYEVFDGNRTDVTSVDAMRLDNRSDNRVSFAAGVDFQKDFVLGQETCLSPVIGVGYRYDAGRLRSHATAMFQDVPGAVDIRSAADWRNALEVEAALLLRVRQFELRSTYMLDLRRDAYNHSVNVELGVSF